MVKTKLLSGLAAVGLVLTSSSSVFATDPIVWQQAVNFSNFHDWGPSQRATSESKNSEIADDCDVVGTISRIDVNGFGVST